MIDGTEVFALIGEKSVKLRFLNNIAVLYFTSSSMGFVNVIPDSEYHIRRYCQFIYDGILALFHTSDYTFPRIALFTYQMKNISSSAEKVSRNMNCHFSEVIHKSVHYCHAFSPAAVGKSQS